MRLKGDFESKWRWPVLFLYKHFSLYGERPLWAIAWVLILWVFFGFLNIFAGLVPDKDYFEKFAICYGSINWNLDFSIIKRTFIGIKTIVLQKDDRVVTLLIDYIFTFSKGLFETLNVMRHDLGDGLRAVISNATLGRFEAPYTLSPRSVWCTILKVVEFSLPVP